MEQKVYVELKKLPSFSQLNEKVRAVEAQCSWWETYGVEWLHNVGAFLTLLVGPLFLRSGGLADAVFGLLLMGVGHVILTQKAGHLASHGALVRSKAGNKFWTVVCVEFLGGYSEHMGRLLHIHQHHPHTNIIGLGDSSSWKIPGLPCLVYMFIAPLAIPLISVPLAVSQLVQVGAYAALPRFLAVAGAGVVVKIAAFVYVSGCSLGGALFCVWFYHALFTIPFIHINIFQHIGLPMYSQKHRPPARIYQMATSVLNIERNPLLDLTFGHALINCHLEHHLFPRLSDSMCLRIKPLVRAYVKESGLPYHQCSYFDRLQYFLGSFDELMVNAPPITHFIGLQ